MESIDRFDFQSCFPDLFKLHYDSVFRCTIQTIGSCNLLTPTCIRANSTGLYILIVSVRTVSSMVTALYILIVSMRTVSVTVTVRDVLAPMMIGL